MRTTADPRELFREIDATTINDGESYTFYSEEKLSDVEIVEEGEELERDETTAVKHVMEFEEFKNDDHEQDIALEALQENSTAVLAGTPIDPDFNYDTLFVDRVNGKTYLVDTSRFGYGVVSEYDDDGDAISGAYKGIFSGAALKIR